MNIEELKQVRLYRQHLTDRTDKLSVVHDLNGLQSQFPVDAFHALRIRCVEPITAENIGEGLVRNWTIRGTVHIFAEDDLGLFKYDRGHYRDNTWNGYFMWENGRPRLNPERQAYWAQFVLDCVGRGINSREELKTACAENGMTEPELDSMFESWGGGVRALCERGFLNYMVSEKRCFTLSPKYQPMSETDAEIEMARRYFTHYGPVTRRDTAYYFGWPQTHVREIMERLPMRSMTIDGKEHFYLGELENDYPDIPRCILLAGFDQLMLGYRKDDSVFLPPEHLRGIFNLTGIVMPPILLNGRVVGKWRKKNRKMTFTLFETLKERDKKAVLREMDVWFDDVGKVEWN